MTAMPRGGLKGDSSLAKGSVKEDVAGFKAWVNATQIKPVLKLASRWSAMMACRSWCSTSPSGSDLKLSGFKRVPVEFADRHEIRLTVMIEVVGKLFQSKSARPDARRKKDERQQRENYSKGLSHLKIPDANNLHTGKPPHTTCQAFNFF